MVMAPANTGRDNNSKRAVIATDHTNKGIRSNLKPTGRMLITVVIKLMAPRIEEIPAKWREKILRSTEAPACAMAPDRGGYTVQPVPAPLSTILPESRSISEGGRSQKLMLFIRGKAMSGALSIKGTSQFPNPPIMMGMTIKKIITKAWAVTITL